MQPGMCPSANDMPAVFPMISGRPIMHIAADLRLGRLHSTRNIRIVNTAPGIFINSYVLNQLAVGQR